MRRGQLVCTLGLAALALAGCGGSSRQGGAGATVTVPAYGVFPATTVSGSAAKPDARACREDVETFAREALQFLAHSGPEAAYPADLYYVLMRGVLADFQAHRCGAELLGSALDHRLTARQGRALVAGLPDAMAGVVREALAANAAHR